MKVSPGRLIEKRYGLRYSSDRVRNEREVQYDS